MKISAITFMAVVAALLVIPAAGWSYEEGTTPEFRARIYGYVESYFEKVMDSPAGVDEEGDTEYESNSHEFDVPDLHVMIQANIANNYRAFLNLAARGAGDNTDDASLDVPNAWLEASIAGEHLMVRGGKFYRYFGLYNEILDATPTYIGIEPPELFDKDHLMLTRTTNLMVHGNVQTGDLGMSYAVMTGNDERQADQLPIGADLRFDFGNAFKIGSSFYTSNGKAVSSRAVGDGSPRGGVMPWMASDRYTVVGGFMEMTPGNFILQGAYWQSYHRARRDPEQTLLLLDAGLYDHQLERFGLDQPIPVAADVIVDVNYIVETYYIRTGYTFTLGENSSWSITPYAQYDFYSNPETIQEKDFGGDSEAGLTDDGRFSKVTAGVVIKPVWNVAIKIDSSAHIQEFNDDQEIYPEVRMSVSYLWQL